jgi:glyoxylase-like metal-dependent hydrolase (beta-lactamase superfamily II)
MSANRWKIGDVSVTRVVESETSWDGTILLSEATASNVKRERDWLHPVFTDDAGMLRMSVHAFVIDSRGERIVVDTCVGNDKERPFPEWSLQHWPFLANLARAGCPRESIDWVLCTHLHLDHVGWNTMLENGRWVPTFPNATYLIGGTEWDFFSTTEEPFMKGPVDDSVRPVVAAGMSQLVESAHRITDEVWLESTAGHTPGHFSVRISSQGEQAVITGDVLHHPILCRYPEWDNLFDYDGPRAKKMRREFCARYADSEVLVLGTHFVTPTAGRIVTQGDSFLFVPA